MLDETAEKEEVVAKEQTINEIEKAGAVKTKPEGGSVSSPFPLNLWRLIDSSSDSSWSSNLSENNQRPNQNGIPNGVKDTTIKDDYKQVQLGRLANEAKSENVLRVSTNNTNNGESHEKAVSLSALEGNGAASNDIEASQRLGANGARPRSNQVCSTKDLSFILFYSLNYGRGFMHINMKKFVCIMKQILEPAI